MAIMENETRGYSVVARSEDLILGDPKAVSRVEGIFVGKSLLTNCPWVSEDAEISANLVIRESLSFWHDQPFMITNHARLKSIDKEKILQILSIGVTSLRKRLLGSSRVPLPRTLIGRNA